MSCSYYRYNSGIIFGDYWCDKKNQAVNEEQYNRYCRNYDYADCPIYRYRESSGCFITTVVCELLGFSDDYFVLNILRDFRNNVLQKDKKYKEVLMEYDVIGPMIADYLRKDSKKQELAQYLYKLCLIPVCNNVLNKRYDDAVLCYQHMTTELICHYGLYDIYNELRNNHYRVADYNQKLGGHGRVLKR